MPSPLIYLANTLNQRITSKIFPWYSFRWLPDEEEWTWRPIKHFPYILFNFPSFVVISSVFFLRMMADLEPEKELVDNNKLMINSFLVQLVVLAVLMDLTINVYGNDWVLAANWVYLAEDKYLDTSGATEENDIYEMKSGRGNSSFYGKVILKGNQLK